MQGAVAPPYSPLSLTLSFVYQEDPSFPFPILPYRLDIIIGSISFLGGNFTYTTATSRAYKYIQSFNRLIKIQDWKYSFWIIILRVTTARGMHIQEGQLATINDTA